VKAGKTMSVGDYFSTLIWILMGLAFIAISLIFLYMIYGEKEEKASSTTVTKVTKLANKILLSAS
jgi:uncharacterized membrane protein